MNKGYSLVVEVEKGSYAVVKVSEEIFSKAKEMSAEDTAKLEELLETSVSPENIMASEMSIFQAASVAKGVSDEFFIIEDKD